MRKSSIEKYFKVLQELYYRIEIMKESNLSLNKFCSDNVIANSTPTSLIELGIIDNSGINQLSPFLVWKGEKPTVKMAQLVINTNRAKVKPNERKQFENIELRNLSAITLQGILSNKSLNHSDEYLVNRAISISKELLKQLSNL